MLHSLAIPATLPAPHREFLERALPVLCADPRLLGVAAGGSWLTGTIDRYSDLDLVIACEPAAHAEVLREAPAIAASLGPLLSAFAGDHVGEPRLFICLYAPEPLHVDLKFVAADELARRVEDPVILWERAGSLARAMADTAARFPEPDRQWIEDRFWTWIHYAATKLGRGELFEVIDFLAALRAMVLGPLLHRRHGCLARGVRRIERVAPAELPALTATLADHSAPSCAAAIGAAAELYRSLRDDPDGAHVVRRAAAERAACDYLARIAMRA
jgi:hypothetical protein